MKQKELVAKVPYIAIYIASMYTFIGKLLGSEKITDSFMVAIGLWVAILFALCDSRKILKTDRTAQHLLTAVDISTGVSCIMSVVLCILNLTGQLLTIEHSIAVIFTFLTLLVTALNAFLNFYPPYKKHKSV